MFKKIAILSVAVAAGLALVSWAGLSSYVSTACSNIKSKLKGEVPIEFEIQRLKQQVSQLVPDMKTHFRQVAEEMVAIDNLKEEIKVTRANLAGQKDDLAVMARELKSDSETVAFNGRDYDRNVLKDKLERDFESYKNCESELRTKERLVAARQKGLDAARTQLAEMRQAKEELEAQIAGLEAQYQEIKLAAARNKFHLDDSQLSQCKKTVKEIQDRLKVAQRTMELEGHFANDAAQEGKHVKSVNEVTKEVESYLGHTNRANGKVAVQK